MVEGALVGIAHDAIKYAEQFADFHAQASFLQNFANRRLAQGFAHFEHAARYRPFSKQWGVGALHEDNAVTLDDDCAHAYQRGIWIFAFHGVSNTPQP